MVGESGGRQRKGKKKAKGGSPDSRTFQQNGANNGAAGYSNDASFPVVSDSRFSSMHSAPAFRRVKADERKVQLDDRFKAVLTDPRFQVPGGKVDKYGRKVSKASKQAKSQLRAFYKVEQDGKDDDAGSDQDQVEADNDEGEGAELDDDAMKGDGNDGAASGKDADDVDIHNAKGKGSKRTDTAKGDDVVEQEQSDVEDELAPADESRQAYLTRLSRGEVSDLSSSDDDSSDDFSDADIDYGSDDGGRAGLDDPSREAVPLTEESTRRLAVTNCDWDHIRAKDLMVLCGSFCPPSSRLLSVTVFPSDFGQEMMKVEAAAGPHAALEGAKKRGAKDEGSEDDEEAEEGATVTKAGIAVDGKVVERRKPGIIIEERRTAASDDDEIGKAGLHDDGGESDPDTNNAAGFNPEKLRVYELRKLKYYFAVLECESTTAAETIYREVDGMEFEHSSVALDLRFIPDDVKFNGRTVRDRSTSVPSSYQPPSFICKALQQTKVECTWDEVSSDRQALLGRVSQWRDAAEEDFEAYLASSSEESSDDDAEYASGSSDAEDDANADNEQNATGTHEESRDSEAVGRRSKQEGTKAASEKAKRARQLLLAGMLDSDSDDEPLDDVDSGREDMEFSYAQKGSAGRSGEEDDEASDSSGSEFTFVNREKGAGGGLEKLLARKKEKEALARETPWEASLRKERERKKARKKALKDKINAAEGVDEDEKAGDDDDDDFFLEERNGAEERHGGKKDKRGNGVSQAEGGGVSGSMGTLGEEDEEEDQRDYDMHRLAREEKLRGKKLRGKRKRKEEAKEKAPGQDFKVDVADERFAAVLEGDTRFGIDRTDASFKDTEGMRQILDERSRRKDRQMANGHGRSTGSSTLNGHKNHGLLGTNDDSRSKGDAGGQTAGTAGDLSKLVNKLRHRGLPGKSGRGVHGSGGDKGRARFDGTGGQRVGGDRDKIEGTGVTAGGGGQGRRGKKKRRKG